MKTFHTFATLCLIILFVSVLTFGQKKKPQTIAKKGNKVETTKETKSKVFSPDNTLIPKSIIQSRRIDDYSDGGAFRCGIFGNSNECDYRKIRQFIWKCWTEKTLGYTTINFTTVDAFSTEHIFIERNRANQWQIVRRMQRSHALLKINKIEDLPVAVSIERTEDKKQKDEWTLTLKNKFGKVVGEY